jgi:hypothetical protein
LCDFGFDFGFDLGFDGFLGFAGFEDTGETVK